MPIEQLISELKAMEADGIEYSNARGEIRPSCDHFPMHIKRICDLVMYDENHQIVKENVAALEAAGYPVSVATNLQLTGGFPSLMIHTKKGDFRYVRKLGRDKPTDFITVKMQPLDKIKRPKDLPKTFRQPITPNPTNRFNPPHAEEEE